MNINTIFTETTKHTNGDARIKKISTSESIKTRFSETGEDEDDR